MQKCARTVVRSVCDPNYAVQVVPGLVGYQAWSAPIAGSG